MNSIYVKGNIETYKIMFSHKSAEVSLCDKANLNSSQISTNQEAKGLGFFLHITFSHRKIKKSSAVKTNANSFTFMVPFTVLCNGKTILRIICEKKVLLR